MQRKHRFACKGLTDQFNLENYSCYFDAFLPLLHHAGASAVLAWLWRIASLLASYSSLTLTACGRSYPVEQKMVGASVLFDTAHYIPLWSFCNQLSTQIAADQDRFKMPHQDEMSESEGLAVVRSVLFKLGVQLWLLWLEANVRKQKQKGASKKLFCEVRMQWTGPGSGNVATARKSRSIGVRT